MNWRPNIRNRTFDWMGEGFKPLIDHSHFLGHSAFDFPSHGSTAANIAKHEKKMVLEVMVPGFTKDDLEVIMKGDLLTVRGTKRQEVAETGVEYVREEFSLDSFERKFKLAEEVSVDRMEAKCENGILRITFFDDEAIKSKKALQVAVE